MQQTGYATPTATEGGNLVFDPPIPVTPLGPQFGAAEKRCVPVELESVLFAGDLQLYAIIDSALVVGLPDILAEAEVPHACLFSGQAASDLAEVAPFVVQLTPHSAITRRLFTVADPPSGWWQTHPAAFVRTSHSLKDVRRHFRKYTRMPTEKGGWVYVRFWQADTMLSLIRNGTVQDQRRYFTLDHEFLAVRCSADGDVLLRMRWLA